MTSQPDQQTTALLADAGIAKALKALDRFEECASDGEDVDLSRADFAGLEWLGWIERISARRRWQMTPEGQAVLAAPASKGKADDWRLIETAPKGGEEILVYVDSEMCVSFWSFIVNDWVFAQPSTAGRFILDTPTHWRPLPAPPVAALASDAGREGV
jgi:hypothetical protein